MAWHSGRLGDDMTEINLLPWREQKREQDQKQFIIYLVISFVSAAVVVFLMYLYASSLVDMQTEQNDRLKSEITKLDAQLNEITQLKKLRMALIARMNIVQNLLATRILTVRLMNEIIRILPDGVYLYHLDRVGEKVTMLGYAESNSDISQLMRNIEWSDLIQDPELTEIKKTADEKPTDEKLSNENEFKLSFIEKNKTNLSEQLGSKQK